MFILRLTLIGIISAKSYSLRYSSIIGKSSSLFFTRSILFNSKITFVPFSSNERISFCSTGDIFLVTSAIRIAQSPSSTDERIDFTIRSPNFVRAFIIPGVSINTYCVSLCVSTPLIRFRVVCGFSLTMDIFSPTSRFVSDDLPAFGLPVIATNRFFVIILPFVIH